MCSMIMLLILLLLLEAVLMVYRIKTKSMQRKLTLHYAQHMFSYWLRSVLYQL
jgi:hypothetical protein